MPDKIGISRGQVLSRPFWSGRKKRRYDKGFSLEAHFLRHTPINTANPGCPPKAGVVPIDSPCQSTTATQREYGSHRRAKRGQAEGPSCRARQSFQMVTPLSLFSEQRRCPSGAQTVPKSGGLPSEYLATNRAVGSSNLSGRANFSKLDQAVSASGASCFFL